jgi:hypothetical protein
MQRADVIRRAAMAQLKGGTANAEEEYEIVYIDGVPYLVRRNSAGQIIEMKPLY